MNCKFVFFIISLYFIAACATAKPVKKLKNAKKAQTQGKKASSSAGSGLGQITVNFPVVGPYSPFIQQQHVPQNQLQAYQQFPQNQLQAYQQLPQNQQGFLQNQLKFRQQFPQNKPHQHSLFEEETVDSDIQNLNSAGFDYQ